MTVGICPISLAAISQLCKVIVGKSGGVGYSQAVIISLDYF